jgi:trehalose 6-phosphate phosphatase
VALPEPASAAGRAGLAAVLADPRHAVVAVDFDGTLAPIVGRPEDARPATGALDALAAVAAAVGTCAVVTGRGAGDVVALAGLDSVPHLHVLGHYGLEEWVDGRLTAPDPDPGVEVARSRLPDVLAAAPPGVHVEDKGQSLVVHTRPAADPAAALAALAGPLGELAGATGLETVPGRFVIELRPAGVDKGLAVRRLALGRRAVLYIGDDLGDLPAYDAVEALRADGVSGLTVASVGGDDAPAELAARADLLLDGPDAVVAFLRGLASVL